MLRSKNVFTKQVFQELTKIRRADIVAGISSLDSEKTIGNVIKNIDKGFQKYFPKKRNVIIVAESSGKDSRTSKAIKKIASEIKTPLVILSSPPMGKGEAVHDLLETARLLNAKALCLFDSDLKSINPEWIKNLAEPILKEGFGFVAPFYQRHMFDGTITNLIVYPLTSALYGKSIRQPIGGEFGISRKMLKEYLGQKVWGTEIGRFGIDVWLTTVAICDHRKIAQANLGVKVHDSSIKDDKLPEESIGAMFTQVVGAMFRMMEHHIDCWADSGPIQKVPSFGKKTDATPKKIVKIDFEKIHEAMQRTAKKERSYWEAELNGDLHKKIKKTISLAKKNFYMSSEEWAEIVFEFALLYKKKRTAKEKDESIKALMPLYLAKLASLRKELEGYTPSMAEAYFRRLISIFGHNKQTLLKRWGHSRMFSHLHLSYRTKRLLGIK